MIQGEKWKVLIGNNLDLLPTLEDNSIDSIVTDPPYELGFMGKKWDSTGIAYNPDLWRECLRVLKPGGHLLSFGGTRTWHRIAVAIEDAGFDVRDSIAWMYGSGFPKSLDISKAIDKGTGENKQRQLKFVNWMKSTGMTASQANKILQEAGVISANGTMAGHFFSHSQAAIATAEIFDCLKPYLPEVPEEIERLVAERTGIEWTAYKNREVVGKKTAGMGTGKTFGMLQSEGSNAQAEKEIDITAPATPEAQQWEGWGTALKPAFEPIIVARKPLIGTVAENVLTYGTGGLNIDGSRIGTEKRKNNINDFSNQHGNKFGNGEKIEKLGESEVTGRWPANVILDEYTAGLLDEQSGQSKSTNAPRKNSARVNKSFGAEYENTTFGHNDSGGASRFFYVAKASKRDRNEGLEGFPYGERGLPYQGMQNMDGGRGRLRQNFHPTVKPTELMRYLVKLVTPPNGLVLDPFTGSGSTGKAAILEGFSFLGMEMTEDYIPIIEGRLKHAEAQAKEDEGLF